MFCCFDVCFVWPPRIFQVQGKTSTVRSVFPDYLSVSYDYDINDMRQAVDCDLFLLVDNYCLDYQHKDVKEIARNLNKNFSDVYDWFVDNKQRIHFGKEKTKCILFDTKHRLNQVGSLDIKYGEQIQIKQYHTTVTYLGRSLDESLSGE